MPKYNFSCSKCQHRTHKFVPSSIEHIECPECGQTMDRELPKSNTTTEVRELVDAYTNKTWNKDQQSILKDRKRQYYIDVEIPRLIEKYSIETCLENKWLIYNDKGELVINKNWTPSK